MATVVPFFSIITAVRNAEAVLAETAQSLRGQNFADYEWIVVDGLSDDGTLGIVRRFIEPGRDQVISEPDTGVYDAMNKGLRLARGQVVQFLNAGDRLADEGVLASVAAAFGTKVDAVYGDTLLALEDGRTELRRAFPIAETLPRRMPISHQALFVRREFHLAYPFDLSYQIAADYAAIAKMHCAGGRMRHLPIPVNINTIEAEAISIRGRVRSAAEDYRIHREILNSPLLAAAWRYLRKRIVIGGVRTLQRLPPGVLARLPEGIRRRIY